MKFFLILLILFIGVLNSLAQKSVNIKKVNSIFLELNNNQNFNKGQTFDFKIMAKLKNGKIKEITEHKNLIIGGEGLEIKKENRILILPNDNCKQAKVMLNYALVKKGAVISDSQEVRFNYKGNIDLDYSGSIGENGEDGKNGIFKGAVFKDGSDGGNGASGASGENGKNIKLFMVQDTISEAFKIKVLEINSKNLLCYLSKKQSPIVYINLSGGNGGKGGDGANGLDGDDAKINSKGKEKRAGLGGNGGNGGTGGTGGDGGSAEVFLHQNVSNLSSNIKMSNNGGAPGNAGLGGGAGSGGKYLTEGAAQSGNQGLNGSLGENGLNGLPVVFKVVTDYDFNF